MKRFLLLALSVGFALGPSLLIEAQSYTLTQISAQKLYDTARLPLNGTIVVTLTDSNDAPVTYTPQGGSPSTAPFTATVKNGAVQLVAGFQPFTVPAAATTSPAGIVYRIQTKDQSGTVVWTFPKTPIDQQYYSLDGYIAQAAQPISGSGAPTVPRCAGGAQYTDTSAPTVPWACTILTQPDNTTVWTQNPSQSPQCPGMAIAYPLIGNPYCLSPAQAFLLPGYVLGNNGAAPAMAQPIVQSGGGGSTPAPPAFAIQFANTTASALQADPYITINPTGHILGVGTGDVAGQILMNGGCTGTCATLNSADGITWAMGQNLGVTGNISAVAATFSGALSASTANVTGALVGTTGNFTTGITAATYTLTGCPAGQVIKGDGTGCAHLDDGATTPATLTAKEAFAVAGPLSVSKDSPPVDAVSGINDWQYLGCSNSITQGFAGGGGTGFVGSKQSCLLQNNNFQAPGLDLGEPLVGPTGWSVQKGIDMNTTVNSPGISNAIGIGQTKAGIGDTTGYYIYNFNYGGAIAGADEGNHVTASNGGEQSSVYTGTVSVGGSGATTVKVNCTNDCPYPGDGRYLIDMTGAATGNATATASPSGNTPGTYSTDIAVTPSTFWGTLAANVVTPLPATGLIGVASTPMTFSVASGPSNTGSPAVGDLVCFAGTFHEQAKITAVSGTGPWTVTVPLRHAHNSGTWMMANGPCGQFISFTANVAHPASQDLRYPIDIMGATDAHTLRYAFFTYQGATSIPFGNQVFSFAPGGTVSNVGGVATFSQGSLWSQHPELFNQTTLTISGTGTAFDGPCTNSVATASELLSCTQAASTGLGPVGSITLGIGSSAYGNTAFTLYKGAEVLDVLDYTTNPPSVSPGNVTTFTLEPNNASWAASDAVENTHMAAARIDSRSTGLYLYNPLLLNTEANVTSITGNGAGQGNLPILAGNYAIEKYNNTGATSNYVYHGGTKRPPGGIMFGAGLFNYGLAMAFAPDPPGSPIISVGCPISGCSDATFNYKVFTLGGGGSLLYTPSTNTFLWGGHVDFNGAPILRPTISSFSNGTDAALIFNSLDGGGASHNITLQAPITNGGFTLTFPALTANSTLALNNNFVSSGASHAAGLVPDPGATAGGGRFLHEDGTWSTATAGGISIPGVLTAGPVSNYVGYSDLMTHTGWSTIAGSVTVTENSLDFPPPFPATQVNKLVIASSGTQYGYTNAAAPVTVGLTYTACAWMRGAVGGETINILINQNNFTGFTLTTGWQYLCGTIVSAGGFPNRNFVFYSTAVDTIYVAGVTTVLSGTQSGYYPVNTGTPVTTPVNTYNVPLLAVGPVSYDGVNLKTSAFNQATFVAGTVTVSNAAACAVGATCDYQLTNCGPAGTAIGVPSLGTVSAGTSFVINSISATNTVVTGDTSKVCWRIN